MKKQRTKLVVLLLALSCASAGIGVGTLASVNASKSNVTASAETTYTEYNVSELTVHVHSTAGNENSNNTTLWLYGTGDTNDDWAQYTLESGAGFKINGTTATCTVQNFKNGLYLEFDAVDTGDVVSIEGAYVNDTRGVRCILPKSSFQWNGSGWEKYVEYTEYNVGKLMVNPLSASGGGAASNACVYLHKENGSKVDDWTHYTYVSGAGFKVNGEAATLNAIQNLGDGLYLAFAGVSEGDIISIEGTYVCASTAIRYVIDETKFIWNGSGWVEYIEYTVCNVGKFAVKSGDATSVYFRPADSNVTLPIDSWEAPFSYVSGNGITVNGTMISMENSVKSPSGDFYVGLGQTVSTGAVLKIGGVLRCDAFETDYVIEDSSFTWNGVAWVADETDEEEKKYTEYNVGKLTVNSNSVPGADTAVNTSLYLIKQNGSTVDDWTRYTYVSGAGFKVNGETATLDAIQNVGSGLYLAFAEVNEGDVISIEGTYVCEDTLIKYVIPESKFIWTGSGWEACIEYEEYNVSDLIVHVHSTAGNENSNNTTLWLWGTGATSDSWSIYTLTNGEGVKLNGETLEATVKEFNGGLHLEFAAVNMGDVISISGTYVCETTAIRYVVDDAKFIWNGSGWEVYIEYTTYELGVIAPNTNSSTFGLPSARPDHLYTVDIALPVEDWETPFVLESGYGVKINDEEVASFEIKSTDGGLWFGLSNVQTNDVISICGTFKNEKHAVKYVIEESKMVWNGSAWEKYVEYTTYDIGTLKLSVTPSSETAVYLSMANGEKMPVDSWDYTFRFRQGSGTGLTLNGVALNTNDIKSPGGDLYIGLGTTVQEGDVLVIGGTFYSIDFEVEYIIADSTFIFENSAWISAFDKAKNDAKADLDAYKENFAQEDYYEAEWASFDALIAEGKASIDAAVTDEEVNAALAAAKAKMDAVVIKEESDAIFNELKVSTKTELATYKSENDYRAADWTEIQAILAKANTEIDASESVTAINTTFANAKAEMDAVKTNAQWEADEAVVAAAKADLAAYKSEGDYKSAEWTEIQAIITEANGDIDNAIGDEEAINGIVAAAKAKMDEVKTAAQVDAEAAVVAAAKADLAAYKSESNYKSAEWTAIQAIITEANGDIDAAIGNEEAINGIVAAAKAEMDKVKTAKVVAKDEVRAYYNAIDHDLYSEEAEEIISGYMTEVMAAIDKATTNEELDAAIAQFKSNVESVETLKPTGSNSSQEDESSGCGSSLALGGVSASVALAAAVAMLLKKKED